MRIVIKNPAPLGKTLTRWGDYHFGRSLQRALEAQGVEVTQHFWGDWETSEPADAILVLRGGRQYRPPSGTVSILWVISHPAMVSIAEMDRYSHVYLGSERHYGLVGGVTTAAVEVLRQCTDAGLFEAADTNPETRRGTLFVANSRGVRRDIVGWMLAAGEKPIIIGRHWNEVGLKHLVRQDYVENHALPARYREARLGLNDHWGDMKYFGYINNRIFDCLASGLPVLSDEFPELRAVCGDGLLYARDAASCRDALARVRTRYPDVLERTRALWARIGQDHTFDARAAAIIDLIARRVNGGDAGHPARGSSSDAEIDGGWDGLLAEARSVVTDRQPDGTLRLLHVFPTVAGAQTLAAQPGIRYLSAGVGEGPWEVFLDIAASQLPKRLFNAVVVEDMARLDTLSPRDRRTFLSALARRLGGDGVLFAGAASSRLTIAGLRRRAGTEGGAIFQRRRNWWR